MSCTLVMRLWLVRLADFVANSDDDIPDWDIIYPVSQFLLSYKIPLSAPTPDFQSPFADTFGVSVASSNLNPVTKQRSMKLIVNHPGIIWSVIAFTGDVVSWSLPESPDRGMHRHHVKVRFKSLRA